MKYISTLLILTILSVSVINAQNNKLKLSASETFDEFVLRIKKTISKDWMFVSATNNSLMFYNKKRVLREKKNISIWVKNYYFDNTDVLPQQSDISKVLKSNNVAYDLFHYNIKCGEEKYVTLSRSFHKIDGVEIGSGFKELNVTSDIAPDTVIAVLYDEVCKVKSE